MTDRSKLSKRDQVARGVQSLGITRLLEALPKRGGLTVLTYHRIGDHHNTEYDPAIYSATAQEFDDQVTYLRRRHNVISLEESIELLRNPNRRVVSSILLTFDDGYLDNYATAFPTLRSHGVPATFFLCTKFVGTTIIPWWDQIAFLIRTTKHDSLCLNYPDAHQFDLKDGREDALRRILKLFKSPATKDPRRMIGALEDACAVSSPTGSERVFLNWEEAAEMLRGGMSIGSHTHAHSVLAKLPYEEQLSELRTSKQLLQDRLGATINSLAYPVGGLTAFSTRTMTAASDAGYDAAFSNYGGFNCPGRTKTFDIQRNSIDHTTALSRFRLQCSLGTITGRNWF